MTGHKQMREYRWASRGWRRVLVVGAFSIALTSAPATALAGGTPGTSSAPRVLLQAAGVLLDPSTVAVSESGTSDTYTVVLASEPTGDVTVTLATPGGQATAVSTSGATSTLTFTDENWDDPQSVTVNAVDDEVAEGDHSTAVTHTASGGGYDSVSIGSVTVEIDDNDVAGASVAPGTVDVAEGGASATYTLVLNSQPTSDVTISITPVGGQVTATATSSGLGTLTFTPSNWDEPQSVTVAAVDDGIVEGDDDATITHSASGGGYGSVPIPSIMASIADNDGADGDVSDGEKPEACSNVSLHPSLKALCRVLDHVPSHARAVISRVIERHADRTPPGQQDRGDDERGARAGDDEDDEDRDERKKDKDESGDRDKDNRGRGNGNDDDDSDRRGRGGDEDEDDEDDDRRDNRRRGRPSWAGGSNR